MKKIILLSAIGLTSILSINAQTISIKPEVGANFSTVSGDVNDTKMNFGPKVGAFVELPLISNLYIEPGVLYSAKGYKTENSTSILGITTKVTSNVHYNYVEIPINVGYRFGNHDDKSGLFVFAGPYLGFAMGGKSKTETSISGPLGTTTKNDDDVKVGNDPGELKSMDYGINLGLGYQLPLGLYVRAQYGLGLANISNMKNTTVHNNVISVGIGYTINFSR